jgi:hypothetical protein
MHDSGSRLHPSKDPRPSCVRDGVARPAMAPLRAESDRASVGRDWNASRTRVQPVTRMLRCAAFVASLLGAQATTLVAQDSTCTYDRCALRLQHGFGYTRVVEGSANAPVASLGLFARRVDALALSPDSTVRVYYGEFRRAGDRSTLFTATAVAAAVAALIVYRSDTHSGENLGVSAGLALTSLGLALVERRFRSRSEDCLQSAIWHYNKNLRR